MKLNIDRLYRVVRIINVRESAGITALFLIGSTWHSGKPKGVPELRTFRISSILIVWLQNINSGVPHGGGPSEHGCSAEIPAIILPRTLSSVASFLFDDQRVGQYPCALVAAARAPCGPPRGGITELSRR
jgi:hypothetical protein